MLSRTRWVMRGSAWWFAIPTITAVSVIVGAIALTRQPAFLAWPFLAVSLIFGLVAWGLSAATGILFLGPEAHRLNKIAAEHGPKSSEAQARLRRILLVARVDVALMFLIVFDMVAKPFSWG